MNRINIALVGIGNWGSNVFRNFLQLSDANLVACCDLDEKRLNAVKSQADGIYCSTDLEAVLSKDIDAVVIATSAIHHFEASKRCLQADKHVFVEKPMALNSREAEELVRLSKQKDKILMVGHLMEYHPAVDKLKEIIQQGQLGEVFYLYTQRVNLGIIRKDENALWSFAPHDISVILYLLNEEPIDVTARGESYIREGIEDVVFVNLRFADRKMAQIQLSWLDPHKIRKITIVGSKKMVVFDDMESMEKIKIYDKGVNYYPRVVSYNESLTLRFGDILIPGLKMIEPLKVECQHFLECIKSSKTPRSDGQDGLRVVKVLEAAQKSLELNGIPVRLGNL